MATPTETPTAEAPAEEVKNETFKTTSGDLVLNVNALNKQQIKMVQDMAGFMDADGLRGLYDSFLKRNAEVKPGRGRTAGPVILDFTKKAADVFAAKILDNKENKAIATEIGVKAGNINIMTSDTALKVVRNMVKEGVVSADQVRSILNAHGTLEEKARKPRADKKQTDAGAPSAAPAASTSEATPAADTGAVQLTDEEMAAIAAAA